VLDASSVYKFIYRMYVNMVYSRGNSQSALQKHYQLKESKSAKKVPNCNTLCFYQQTRQHFEGNITIFLFFEHITKFETINQAEE